MAANDFKVVSFVFANEFDAQNIPLHHLIY